MVWFLNNVCFSSGGDIYIINIIVKKWLVSNRGKVVGFWRIDRLFFGGIFMLIEFGIINDNDYRRLF